jgi:hypothetical protein
LLASSTHFQDAVRFQISETGVITLPCAACKLINTQEVRRGERLLFIQAQSLAFDGLQGHALEALLGKPWPDSDGCGHMRDGLAASALADLFS